MKDLDQERNQRERSRQAALQRAHSDGALDGLLEFLNGRIVRHEVPGEPTGAEWPYKRAFHDGQLSEAVAVVKWLEGRLKQSPDGAKNTEG